MEEEQRHVHKPEAPLKERSWFERHLNWTMVLAWVGAGLITILVAEFFIESASPYTSSEEDVAALGLLILLIGLIVLFAVSIPIGWWVLRKKNRSLAWLLICWTLFFLLIGNKSTIQDAYGKTMADYDKAIELDPNDANAYFNRGDAYDEIGEYGKAIADYSIAIELNPAYALAYYNRGCAYAEIGKYEKAIDDYNKTIELNPNDADAYYSRGLSYREKGEVARAVSDLEKCIGLSIDPELGEAAQQALKELRK